MLIPPFGTFYLPLQDLVLLPPVTLFSLYSYPSVRDIEITVPPDPGLLGLTVYVQGLIMSDWDPFGDAQLTNYTADVILR